MANSELDDFKQKLKRAPVAERLRMEMQRAKELGLSITPEQLIAIGTPSYGRTKLEDEHGAVKAASDWGGVDMDIRRSMQPIISASAFRVGPDSGRIRDAVMRLGDARANLNPQDLGGLVSDIQSRLELLTTAGDLPEMMSQVDAAFANGIFANADPDRSEKGLGGAPNHQAYSGSSK